MRILLIEDDKETAETLKGELSQYFVVEIAKTGEEGDYLTAVNEYDAIILDLVLPDIDGITLCKKLRENNTTTPILILTGQMDTLKKVNAFDVGADDYLTKPFAIEELFARVRALLRRKTLTLSSNVITLGDLTIDLSRKEVKRGNETIHLRRKEFYLLEYLARNVGRVITREMILDHVWESKTESFTNIVDVHIKYLRDQIDRQFDKKLIKTVHGLGYKLEV